MMGGREWVEEDVATIQCRLDGGSFTAAELMRISHYRKGDESGEFEASEGNGWVIGLGVSHDLRGRYESAGLKMNEFSGLEGLRNYRFGPIESITE